MLYDVSKKANIHMITTDDTLINVLRGFDIISHKGKPNKTVISISTGGIEEDKLTELINKGFIIIVAI
eukprot:jgi/Orpsp1_1/1189814/evm.model.d7180000074679.1